MRSYERWSIFLLLSITILWGAVNRGDITFLGIVDASGAVSTKPAKSGTTPPATCSVGETFFDTDATAGQNWLLCTATNTWTAIVGGTGAPTDAKYWVSEANGTLSAEANLGALADNGVVAVDVAAGAATPRAALYTDVVPLWASGSCSGFLKHDGTCAAAPGGGGYWVPAVSTSSAIADATPTYWGAWPGLGLSTVYANRAIRIPATGTITAATAQWNCTATPTAENTTFAFRLNDTTDTNLTTTANMSTGALGNLGFTGLSIAVTAGDTFVMKILGTWATNPACAMGGGVYIEP